MDQVTESKPQMGKRCLRRTFSAAGLALVLISSVIGSVKAGSLSGLSWNSGAACSSSEFENWRGRKMDVVVKWAPFVTWDHTLRYFRGTALSGAAQGGRIVSIGLGMVPEDHAGRFAQCAQGQYDAYFREIGQQLAAKGLGDAVIRLGWEANGDWYPWSIGEQVDAYKACFRRQAGALRSSAPGLRIEWDMEKKGRLKVPVTNAYPGDDVVSHVGVHHYDRWPVYSDEAMWQRQYNATNYGGPKGIGAWLSFAKSRGKKLAVAEWAVSDGWKGVGFDNPFYIGRMYSFFRDNASSIAYESYFNCPKGDPNVYLIHPAQNNPRAAERYRSLYSAGQ